MRTTPGGQTRAWPPVATQAGINAAPAGLEGLWETGAAWSVPLSAADPARESVTIGYGGLPQAVAAVAVPETGFAAGTRLLTELGACEIERLRAGHRLLVHGGGSVTVRRLVLRDIDLTTHAAAHDLHPVRLRAGAIADGRPYRDLLLAPDQDVVIDGVAVAARRLVNQATVVRETELPHITYCRLELDAPAVLLADGLPAAFGPAVAAPADGEVLERVWRRIVGRATLRGYVRDDDPALTLDAGLALRVDGRIVPPITVQGGRHVFAVPAGAEAVWLISRVARPSDSRPWSDDRRWAGVLVERLEWRQEGGVTPIALDNPALHDGWHRIEPGTRPRRWTAGAARLPAPHGDALLDVHVSDSLVYAREMDPGACTLAPVRVARALKLA